jgi:hypothetical protein
MTQDDCRDAGILALLDQIISKASSAETAYSPSQATSRLLVAPLNYNFKFLVS